MKKIIFFINILILIIISIFLLQNNSDLLIYTKSFEITVTTLSIGCIILIIFLLGFILGSVNQILIKPNKTKLNNKINKIQKDYNNFLNDISDAYIYLTLNKFNSAKNKLNDTNKIFKNTLILNLLRAKIYCKENNFKEAINLFKFSNKNKNIVFNGELLVYNLALNNAVQDKDEEKIKEFSLKIIEINSDHKDSLKNLYVIYKNSKKWSEANETLTLLNKNKFIDKNYFLQEYTFINTNIVADLYSLNNLDSALSLSKDIFHKNKKYAQNNLLLVKILEETNSKELLKYIKIVWVFTPFQSIGNTYLKFFTKEKEYDSAKSLFKNNKNNLESIIFFIKVCLKNNKIKQAEKLLEKIKHFHTDDEICQLFLDFENLNSPNSEKIKGLEEKIKNSKKYNLWLCSSCFQEYNQWQCECDSCKKIDTIILKNKILLN